MLGTFHFTIQCSTCTGIWLRGVPPFVSSEFMCTIYVTTITEGLAGLFMLQDQIIILLQTLHTQATTTYTVGKHTPWLSHVTTKTVYLFIYYLILPKEERVAPKG